MKGWWRALRGGLALLALAGLGGCADLHYYAQSIGGHLNLMHLAKPIPDWLADEQVAPALKAKLQLAQQIRQFAVTELKLPDNASYHRYAELQRRAAVWNVVAAPEFSLKAKTWCFPVTGCVGYRGYFDRADAQAEADTLKAEGLEVGVYAVPAYSTLGWMNWAGGDPLLSTFINYPEGELARLIFHELAHQVAYASGDTEFNESFATAVERLGVEHWLVQRGSPTARQDYEAINRLRNQFRTLTLAMRKQLQGLYPDQAPTDLGQLATLRSAKEQAYADFRSRYAQLRVSWGADANRVAGYDGLVANANNAQFAALAAYDELVPAFEALFEREGRDWQRFYDAAKRLAKLSDKDERRRALTTPKNTTTSTS
jgi:predicted aminopeptidase